VQSELPLCSTDDVTRVVQSLAKAGKYGATLDRRLQGSTSNIKEFRITLRESCGQPHPQPLT
jgi:hypothetical protein